jgi:hypothetical protein
LELTWITFPALVFVVSAAACVGAYALKGDELRINKVDLVDVDLPGKRCYGTTWYTLFSPRTQLYAMRIEPAAPAWASERTDAPGAGIVMSWFGRPEAGFGGFHRPRSQNVFRQKYEYEEDATGLTNVPIAVWTSKSFIANWEGAFASDQPASRLRRRQHGGGLDGIVTNPLRVPLHDAVVIHGESESQVKVYQLGTMLPGQSKPIVVAPDVPLSQWLLATATSEHADHYGLMRRIMFHDATANLDGVHNRALRYLDQSWRRSLRSAAILVGRMPPVQGPAATVMHDPVSPSRLGLGQPPDSNAGTLAQQTYVRVFLPVISRQ